MIGWKAAAAAAVCALSVVAGMPGMAQDEVPTTVKENRFEFSLPDLAGKTVSQSDEQFKGKVVLVDIWGTWCPPCRKEIPSLVKLHEKYRDQGLEIVGIAFEKKDPETNQKALAAFVAENKISYTVLYGGRTAVARMALPTLQNFRGYPTGIFIGRDGVVRKVEVGFSGESSVKMIEEEIVKLLKEK